jgi:hypothetical protein
MNVFSTSKERRTAFPSNGQRPKVADAVYVKGTLQAEPRTRPPSLNLRIYRHSRAIHQVTKRRCSIRQEMRLHGHVGLCESEKTPDESTCEQALEMPPRRHQAN